MKHIKYISILLIFGILINSCKTKKKLERNRSTEMNIIYDSIINRYVNYETLLIKTSTSFENKNKKMKLKGTIKIKKDSLIIISLSPGLGIEAARIKFTKDSIYFLDRLSSQLTKSEYKFINDTYKIDIGYVEIQAILTNELFIYPKNNENDMRAEFVNSFGVRSNTETLDLYRKNEKSVENLISINTNKYSIGKYIINDITNKRYLNIEFQDVYSDELGNLPKIILVVSSVEDKFNKIKLNYLRISKNKKLNFSFTVPKSYKSVVY